MQPIPNITMFIALFLCALLTACTKERPAAAPNPSPTTEPPDESMQVPVEQAVLPNGLRVLIHQDQSTPFVTVNLSVLAGSGRELAGEEGAAYLLQYLLFQAGSDLRENVLKILDDAGADTAGGAVSSNVDYDRLTLTSTVPGHALPTVLWLEAKRLQGFLAGFSDDIFQKQQAHVREAVTASQEKPYGLQNELISRHIYHRGHPYASPVTATPAAIGRLTLAQVQDFYRRNVTPQNAVLVISGNVDATSTMTDVRKFFSSLKPAAATTQIVSDAVGPQARRTVTHRSNAPAKQVFVWRGPAIHSPQLVALEMAGAILTGGKTARLHEELVRKSKLATHVTSTVQAARLGSEILIEVFPTDGADPETIANTVEKTLASTVAAGLGETDVTTARAKAEFEFFRSVESSSGPQGKAARFARSLLFETDPLNIDGRFLAKEHLRIAAQTPAKVTESLKTWMTQPPALEIRFMPADFHSAGRPPVHAEPPANARLALPAVLPGFSRKELANGLDLIVFDRSKTGSGAAARNVEVDLVIKTTDLFESEDTAGISMLTAKAVLAGTKTRSAFQVENAVNSFGGTLSSDGSKFGARVSISGLRRYLDGMFELLADVAVGPVFPETELSAVKKIVTEKLVKEQQYPQQAASLMFSKILFAGGHPGGSPADGAPAAVEKLAATALKDHHAKYWVPNNSALIVSGPVSLEDAERLANKHFAFWSRKNLEAVTLQDLPGPDRTYAFLVHVPAMSETLIRMGSVAPYRGHADETGLQVLSQILTNRNRELAAELLAPGGRVTSNLIQNRHFGYWMHSATARPGKAVSVVNAMQQSLHNLTPTGGGVSADELARAQNDLARNFLRSFDTAAFTNKITASLVSSGITPARINSWLPDLYQITPQAVSELAGRHGGHNRRIILFMGDLTGIEADLLKRKVADIVTLDRDGKFLRRTGS